MKINKVKETRNKSRPCVLICFQYINPMVHVVIFAFNGITQMMMNILVPSKICLSRENG